jgi:hypothetical protein
LSDFDLPDGALPRQKQIRINVTPGALNMVGDPIQITARVNPVQLAGETL